MKKICLCLTNFEVTGETNCRAARRVGSLKGLLLDDRRISFNALTSSDALYATSDAVPVSCFAPTLANVTLCGNIK
jgi:hypothetical protein